MKRFEDTIRERNRQYAEEYAKTPAPSPPPEPEAPKRVGPLPESKVAKPQKRFEDTIRERNRQYKDEYSPPSPARKVYLTQREEDLANYNFKQSPAPEKKSAPVAKTSPPPSNYEVSRSVPRSAPVARDHNEVMKSQTRTDSPKQSFGRAFAAARMRGAKEFTWNGKRYHTRRADGK